MMWVFDWVRRKWRRINAWVAVTFYTRNEKFYAD